MARVLGGLRVVLLNLCRILVEFGVALLELVRAIGKTAGVVDAAIAAAAKPGIGSAVGKSAVAGAGAPAAKAPAMKTAKAAAVEAAKTAPPRNAMAASVPSTIKVAVAAPAISLLRGDFQNS